MSARVIQTRRPEYAHAKCPKCRVELEYSPSSVSSGQDLLQCYMCQSAFSASGAANNQSNAGRTSVPNAASNAASNGWTRPKRGTDDRPLETEYYELLGVSINADADDIRRAYRQLALKLHPDKNHSSEAEERFKKISEAYQVLSDPQLRHKYNVYGTGDAIPQGGFADPEDFFKSQFGGEAFVDIIGEISIGRDMREVLESAQMDEDSNGIEIDEARLRRETNKPAHDEERERLRAERVETLRVKLVEKLDYYVRNKTPNAGREFRQRIEAEANELRYASYGVQLLHAIGFTYSLKAKQALGSAIPRFGHILREKGHVFSETLSTLKSAIDLQQSFAQLQNADKKGLDEIQRNQLEEAAASKGMQALWKGSKLEVEGVLREVCDRVLYEPEVSKEDLRRRAEALKVIGEVYEFVKDDAVRES